MSQNVAILTSLQPFENVKTISLQTVQKRAVDSVQPADCGLPTPMAEHRKSSVNITLLSYHNIKTLKVLL